MAFSRGLLRRFGSVPMLLSGVAAMAVRYYILSSLPPWPGVRASQVLHGLVFGGFHIASMHIIYRITPDAFRASGQTFTAALLGMGGIAGSLLGGTLAGRFGIARFFRVFSLVAAVGFILLAGAFLACRAGEVRHDARKLSDS